MKQNCVRVCCVDIIVYNADVMLFLFYLCFYSSIYDFPLTTMPYT